jgi:hypothetical protein
LERQLVWQEWVSPSQFFAREVSLCPPAKLNNLICLVALQASLMVQRKMTVSLEIPSKDRSYHWVLQWINAHSSHRTQHLGLETKFKQHDNGSVTTSFDYVPSPGRHFIRYKRNWIQVHFDENI